MYSIYICDVKIGWGKRNVHPAVQKRREVGKDGLEWGHINFRVLGGKCKRKMSPVLGRRVCRSHTSEVSRTAEVGR